MTTKPRLIDSINIFFVKQSKMHVTHILHKTFIQHKRKKHNDLHIIT